METNRQTYTEQKARFSEKCVKVWFVDMLSNMA